MKKLGITKRQRGTLDRYTNSYGALAILDDGLGTVIDPFSVAAGAPATIWKQDARLAAHILAIGKPAPAETARVLRFLRQTMRSVKKTIRTLSGRLTVRAQAVLAELVSTFAYKMGLTKLHRHLRNVTAGALTVAECTRLRDAIWVIQDVQLLRVLPWQIYELPDACC